MPRKAAGTGDYGVLDIAGLRIPPSPRCWSGRPATTCPVNRSRGTARPSDSRPLRDRSVASDDPDGGKRATVIGVVSPPGLLPRAPRSATAR